MRQPVISMREDDTLEEAARVMLENKLRGVPVVDERGKISGFLSVSDYLAKDKVLPFSRFHAPQLFGKWIGKEGIEKIYRNARRRCAIRCDAPMLMSRNCQRRKAWAKATLPPNERISIKRFRRGREDHLCS